MYELYYAPGTASFVVHWMLVELNVPHTLRRVDFAAGEQKSAAYLRLNPAGVVPTLIIDGVAHTEAAALALTLADRYPNAALQPPPEDPARAEYYQWAFFGANTLQPAYRQWFYPQEHPGAPEAVQAHARARIEAGWERVDALLSDGRSYLLGEQLTAIDFYLTMLMRWSRHMPKPASAWPALGRYIPRMRAMPSFQAVCDREGLTDWR